MDFFFTLPEIGNNGHICFFTVFTEWLQHGLRAHFHTGKNYTSLMDGRSDTGEDNKTKTWCKKNVRQRIAFLYFIILNTNIFPQSQVQLKGAIGGWSFLLLLFYLDSLHSGHRGRGIFGVQLVNCTLQWHKWSKIKLDINIQLNRWKMCWSATDANKSREGSCKVPGLQNQKNWNATSPPLTSTESLKIGAVKNTYVHFCHLIKKKD